MFISECSALCSSVQFRWLWIFSTHLSEAYTLQLQKGIMLTGELHQQTRFTTLFWGLSWWELLYSWMQYCISIHFFSLFLLIAEMSGCFGVVALYFSRQCWHFIYWITSSLQIVSRPEQQNYKTKDLHPGISLALASWCRYLRRSTDMDESCWRDEKASCLMLRRASWKLVMPLFLRRKERRIIFCVFLKYGRAFVLGMFRRIRMVRASFIKLDAH
jgi:hypothetical protein